MTLIRADRAKERYEDALAALKKSQSRLRDALAKLERDYANGLLTKEMFILAKGQLENKAMFDKQEFIKKHGVEPPKNYVANPFLTIASIEAQRKIELRNMIHLKNINSALQKHKQDTFAFKKQHIAQIENAEGRTPEVRERTMIAPQVRAAVERFEGFLSEAITLGMIQKKEAMTRIRTAEAEGSGITNRSPPRRKYEFIHNLIAQIESIMKRGI